MGSARAKLRDDSGSFAEKKGWDLAHIRMTPTFSKLKKMGTRDWKGLPLEGIIKLVNNIHAIRTDLKQDLESAAAGIEADMEKRDEKEARAKWEKIYLKKRASVAAEHSALVEREESYIIPSLNSYRGLPSIKALLMDEQTSDSVLRSKLREGSRAADIKADIKLWTTTVISVFNQKLSSIEYHRETDKSFCLVDSVFSWFLCSKCGRHDRGRLLVPLSPRDACLHVCPHSKTKQKKNYSWSAEQFEIDEKVKISPFIGSILSN